MKKRNLFLTLGLALTLGAGVAGGLSLNRGEAKEVEAAVVASGKITIDVTGGSWATNAGGQKFSVKFTDGANEGWGSFVTGNQYVYLIEIPYSLEFTPTKMTAYRYNPSKTSESWASNKETDVWNKSSELDFEANANIIIGDWDTDHNSATVGMWGIAGKSLETNWQWTDPLTMFTRVKLNGSNHAEYYGTFTLTQWEEFVVHDGDTYTKWAAKTLSSNVDSSEWKSADDSSDGNIQYKGSTAKDFALYYDRNAHTIFINDPVHAYTDDFALFFLRETNGYCENSISEEIQAELKGEYDLLASTTGAQEAFYESTVKRGKGQEYDSYSSEALSRYVNMQEEKGYGDFLGLSTHNPAASAYVPTFENNSNNNLSLVIIIASSIALIAAGSFFVIRRRKEQE